MSFIITGDTHGMIDIEKVVQFFFNNAYSRIKPAIFKASQNYT